ncbi:MAG TPA: hypothetical protein PKD72_05345 [Gemmatales bacterium]|nr:hypothetical protein [Gemmatales bacterium]
MPRTCRDTPSVRITLELDLGQDLGQNFGTLFELRDVTGETLLGAGFPGAYNTHDRADRYSLHFYCRTSSEKLSIESLPRPTTDSGVYLHDVDGQLTARSLLAGKDMAPRHWDTSSSQWKRSTSQNTGAMRVRGKLLTWRTNRADYDGQPILHWSGPGRLELFLYANGQLLARQHFPEEPVRNGKLLAMPWSPYSDAIIDPARAQVLELPTPRAFPYASCPLGEELLITTNIGQVHRLTAQGWSTLRETDGQSFQIYASLYTHDRLWLGQYPTGHLFEYRSGKLAHLAEQPPRMPGVSPAARELQTLAIYRGDIYAGLWPWGEVWRYRAGARQWEFVQRFFTHPQPTAATIHPYEKETAAVDTVANLWGQRISSMVPLGEYLYLSTSAKGTPAFDPRFTFLAENHQWQEYGMVYRCKLPGQVSAPITWQDKPIRLEFVLENDQLRVLQDGSILASTSLTGETLPPWRSSRLHWATGLYGNLHGKIILKQATVIPADAVKR